MHAVGNLVELLSNGSFLRETDGLNSLPTFKKIAQILQKPSGFPISQGQEPITSFIRNSTQRK